MHSPRSRFRVGFPSANGISNSGEDLDSVEEGGMDPTASKSDPRVDWMCRCIRNYFAMVKGSSFDTFLSENENTLVDFLNSHQKGVVFVQAKAEGLTLEVTVNSPPVEPTKLLYFAKLSQRSIPKDGFIEHMSVGDCTEDAVRAVSNVARFVYVPMMFMEENEEEWSESVRKEVLESMNAFIAQTQITYGLTQQDIVLPVPALHPILDLEDDPTNGHGHHGTGHHGHQVEASVKSEQIHLLESCLITWTRQIKGVIRMNPESNLSNGQHPGPLEELSFWETKAKRLNAIFAQLQTVELRKILGFLDRCKSTYTQAFGKLCKEMLESKEEANDNIKYLRVLYPWFKRLETDQRSADLCKLFRPIMHTILLIWKSSGYYNTPTRLVILLRQICNAIISQTTKLLKSSRLLERIEMNEAHEASALIQDALCLIGMFKSTYFDHKAKANAECLNNPWRIQNSSIFLRLDSFLERCHDLLDLTQTITQFSHLQNLEIGGTKGRTLTTTLTQIHDEFTSALAAFKNVSYDLLHVEASGFDDDFYEFRLKIRELERRLASILTQGFEDCSTIVGRFKLLDSFEKLLDRQTIQAELAQKHLMLLRDYGADLAIVNEVFASSKAAPPIAKNMPPTAGSVLWCRGLLDRIKTPMESLKRLDSAILDRDGAKGAIKSYTSLVSQLSDYEAEVIGRWEENIETSSLSKLKLPLLVRETTSRMVRVNFDPALVQLLREVKYLTTMKIEIPRSVSSLYEKAEQIRRDTGNLDLLVATYNQLVQVTLPIEAPLMKPYLDKADAILEQGMKTLTWKSSGIDTFMADAANAVSEASAVHSKIKENVYALEGFVAKWCEEPMMTRWTKSATVAELEELFLSHINKRYAVVEECGKQLHRQLKETIKVLKISTGLPDWKAYLDFLSKALVDGLVKAVCVSLEYLVDQVNPDNHGQEEAPLLEVSLSLSGHHILYSPVLPETPKRDGVKDQLRKWVGSFLKIGALFPRVDGQSGSYVKDIEEYEEVHELISKVYSNADNTFAQAQQLHVDYRRYEYLYTTDLAGMFTDFLQGAWVDGEEGEEEKQLDLAQFNERIQELNSVRVTISELAGVVNLGFLRVNTQPIKQALSTWVTKWIYVFTQYLSEFVVGKLELINLLMEEVANGMDFQPEALDPQALMQVISLIQRVQLRLESIDQSFAPLQDIVVLLKAYGISLEDARVGDRTAAAFLQQAPELWNSTASAAFKAKESIQPYQAQASDAHKESVQAFEQDTKQFRRDFLSNGPFAIAEGPSALDNAYNLLYVYHSNAAQLEAEQERLKALSQLFETAVYESEELAQVRRDLSWLKRVCDVQSLFTEMVNAWATCAWKSVAPMDLENQVFMIKHELDKFPSLSHAWPVLQGLREKAARLGVVVPIISRLQRTPLHERHWKRLMNLSGNVFERGGGDFELGNVFKLELFKWEDEVDELINTAEKEINVEQKLASIKLIWNNMELRFNEEKITLALPQNEVLTTLEEHQVELQAMSAMGKYVQHLAAQVGALQTRLSDIETMLFLWIKIQQHWAKLEPIYCSSQDVRRQLPEQAAQFEQLDLGFKALMKEAKGRSNVLEVFAVEGIGARLEEIWTEVEVCSKALKEYLDVKKDVFPRFHFVSNASLLEILANGENPAKVLQHTGPCFDALHALDFVQDKPLEACGLRSKDGETVPFAQPLLLEMKVEEWLQQVVQAMRRALKAQSSAALDTMGHNYSTEWINTHAAQVCVLASRVAWTEETALAIESVEECGEFDSFKAHVERWNKRVQGLIEMAQQLDSPTERLKVLSLITTDAHARDMTEWLLEKGVDSLDAFEWQSKLRYYWDEADEVCAAKICDYQSVYSNEYVGNTTRLVITPLTERCHITLSMALRLQMGAAAIGPAGTGKTETTKDLGKALGRCCFVFNCSDQMSFSSVGDILRGLTQSGAWGCLDEFNRIPVHVLSVVATQIAAVFTALRTLQLPENRPQDCQHLRYDRTLESIGSASFMGHDVAIVPTFAFFVTMNPGYAGRTELPENLKIHLRPCAMVRPDLAPICENILMAQGFLQAKRLSVKFIRLYQMAAKVLSPQAHYDWGLRNIKAILEVAGDLRRQACAAAPGEETAILMRSLRDFNSSRLTAPDQLIFSRLIQDLFPSISCDQVVHEQLQADIRRACSKLRLQPEDTVIANVVALHDVLNLRHSAVLLGSAGSGKSSVWKALGTAYNVDKRCCAWEVLNPKALSPSELFGCMTDKREWEDGALSLTMRRMAQAEPPYTREQTAQWVVLDGDIDADWIESLNTVMDDNKVLTLVSNERIALTPPMRLVFETNSLQNATPATVSRAGIVFVKDGDLTWHCVVESWVASVRVSDSVTALLPSLFDKYIPVCLDLVEQRKTLVPQNDVALVQNICHLLAFYISRAKVDVQALEHFFAFACVWGAAAALSTVGEQRRFSSAFLDEFKGLGIPVQTAQDTVFDFAFDLRSHQFQRWDKDAARASRLAAGALVHTEESAGLQRFMHMFLSKSRPVLVVGGPGTGKTAQVGEFLRTHEDSWQRLEITMNYFMDAPRLQQLMEQPLHKRSGRTYGPAGTQELVYFIDDFNLPNPDAYGTQTPLALLRLYLDHSSWRDRKDLGVVKQVRDTQLLAAMTSTGSLPQINPRALRHFAVVAWHVTSVDAMVSIFQRQMAWSLDRVQPSHKALSTACVTAAVELHATVKDKFAPTAKNLHYVFTMRDMCRLVQGLSMGFSMVQCKEANDLIKVFLHECRRVYKDRLNAEREHATFESVLVTIAKKHFELELESLFTDTLLVLPDASTGTYTQLADTATLRSKLIEPVEQFNKLHPGGKLVLFDNALEHLLRVMRIIIQPSGNALLVGLGGSGKRSIVRLAAFLCGFRLVEAKAAGKDALLEDLKQLCVAAGARPGHQVVLMVNVTHVSQAEALTSVNDLLSTGVVPQLFSDEELEGILTSLRSEAREEGVADIMEFFVTRVRRNLHVVLCFSPVGDTFRLVGNRLPPLLNRCTVDWFHPWSRAALVAVASSDVGEAQLGPAELSDNVAHHMAEVHCSVVGMNERLGLVYNYVTPKSFLDLLSLFKAMLAQRGGQLEAKVGRLKEGLQRLKRTEDDVLDLKQELEGSLERVRERKVATEELLEKMGHERGEAEAQQKEASKEQVRCEALAAEAAEMEAEAAVELSQAQPLLEDAAAAVNCLTKASLTELKSLTKPPAGVDKVLTCVLMMVKREKKNLSWENAKRMMSNIDKFKASLEAYNAKDIPAQVLARIHPILSDASFTYNNLLKKSTAAANMANWVINIVNYNKIYQQVRPLMLNLESAKNNKAAADEVLAKVMASLAETTQRLEQLQATFLAATKEKTLVEQEAKRNADRLALATRLVNGLVAENARWQEDLQATSASLSSLVGDTLLAASFVNYAGAFSAPIRQQLWTNLWTNDLNSREVQLSKQDTLTPVNLLSTPSQRSQWMLHGLPPDPFSIQNAAVVVASKRWPLLIDPQLQGLFWLKRNFPGATHCLPETSAEELKQTVEEGGMVLLENLGEEMPRCLLSLLRDEAGRREAFKLVLQTKLSNPHYRPEMVACCTLISFSITPVGLENQMLAKLMGQVKAELEDQSREVETQITKSLQEMLHLEDVMLQKLGSGSGDILSDESLVESIEATKQTVAEIKQAVQESRHTQEELQAARECYRSVAKEAAVLFFAIRDLHHLNHTYRFSLALFERTFQQAVMAYLSRPQSANDEDEDEEVNEVIAIEEQVRSATFKSIAQGLLQEHRLTFLVLIATRLSQEGLVAVDNTGFTPEGLAFLLSPGLNMEMDNPIAWLSDARWQMLCALSTMEGFEGLSHDVEESAARFQEWFELVDVEKEPMPLQWRDLEKHSFRKLLVVRCLRPDRVCCALKRFVQQALPNADALLNCDKELMPLTVLQRSLQAYPDPVYLVQFSHMDVTSLVRDAAVLLEHPDDQLVVVSMGQGQDVVAMAAIEQAMSSGHWVFLTNLHLMPQFAAALQQRLDAQVNPPHDRFRLVISSSPSISIPSALLERSIKVATQPIQGFVANLQASLTAIAGDIQEFNNSDPKVRCSLFGLAWVHTLMMQRRAFGSSGFNREYAFSMHDLQASARVLKSYADSESSHEMPWNALQYLVGEVVYGGSIIDEFDQKVCNTYMQFFFCPNLFKEMDLLPFPPKHASFCALGPSTFEAFRDHIDGMNQRSSIVFGLHPNAEIVSMTEASKSVLREVDMLRKHTLSQEMEGIGQPVHAAHSWQHMAEAVLQDVLESYNDIELSTSLAESFVQDDNEDLAFVWVLLEEARRMQTLIATMVQTSKELESAFQGEIVLSTDMQITMSALANDKVPQQWAANAYPSTRALAWWLNNLEQRVTHLTEWLQDPSKPPICTWLPAFFNPSAFVLAVNQSAARASGLPLEEFIIGTEVLKKYRNDIDERSRDGAYVYGLFIDGAGWDVNGACLAEPRPRETFCEIPVINVKAVLQNEDRTKNKYICPVYRTQARGETLVFCTSFKSREPIEKWTLAGVAAILDAS